MTRVLVLGGTGMLGSMVVSYLAQYPELKITATARNYNLREAGKKLLPQVEWFHYNVQDTVPVYGFEWVINAIGITKPHINETDHSSVLNAININARFPHYLASQKAKVIQIATDCVYSGNTGWYEEQSAHDAQDTYGRTKSLGEVRKVDYFYNLRCSIIGPEPKKSKFLIGWLLDQPEKSQVQGYYNHKWNGITTLHFAKLCRALIKYSIFPRPVQHIVPGETVNKHTLLSKIAQAYGREDIVIDKILADKTINRTLITNDPAFNAKLWFAAGYDVPPTMDKMLTELVEFNYVLKDLES